VSLVTFPIFSCTVGSDRLRGKKTMFSDLVSVVPNGPKDKLQTGTVVHYKNQCYKLNKYAKLKNIGCYLLIK